MTRYKLWLMPLLWDIALSAVHNGFGDGPSASNHHVLHTLMKENHGLRIETDLGLSQGARSLAQGPFELMGRASLRDLWVKMAFPTQLGSGRRAGWLQTSCLDPSH